MRKTFSSLYIILLVLLASCKTNIKITEYINANKPLTLTIIHKDSKSLSDWKHEIISPGSIRFNKFINWCENNTSDWAPTPASYATTTTVTQDDFRFLYFENGVVIGFIDKKGNAQQYMKSIRKGELDFLINAN